MVILYLNFDKPMLRLRIEINTFNLDKFFIIQYDRFYTKW